MGCMHYGDRNGLQDQKKPKKTYGHAPLIQLCTSRAVVPHHVPSKHNYPKVLLCFKSDKQIKHSKSRELLGSVLHVGCDCERRNGLQDQCPRTECRGSPECLTVPPTCGPSEFSQNKHMVRIYEENQRKRNEFVKKFKEQEAEKERRKNERHGHNTKADYTCFPLVPTSHKHHEHHGHHCTCCEHHDHHAHHPHHDHHAHHPHHDHHVDYTCFPVDKSHKQHEHHGHHCTCCEHHDHHGHHDHNDRHHEHHGHHDHHVDYTCFPVDKGHKQHEHHGHHCTCCEHHDHHDHHGHHDHHDHHDHHGHHDHHDHHGHHGHYDCSSLHKMIHDGLQCPVCTEPLADEKKPKPIILQLPVNCLCPGAS